MNQDVITRNNVHVLGTTGQPIMFAHGFGCEQRIWQLVAPVFARAYQPVLFDYVGSGMSDPRAFSVNRYATLDGYAQDVLDICMALDLRNLIFVGHSINRRLALARTATQARDAADPWHDMHTCDKLPADTLVGIEEHSIAVLS